MVSLFDFYLHLCEICGVTGNFVERLMQGSCHVFVKFCIFIHSIH